MTALDVRLIPKVLEIVERLGKRVTFTVAPPAAYNPDTGEAAQVAAATYSKKVSPPDLYHESLVNGDNIRKGDVRVWLPAGGLEFTPVINASVTIDGTVWTVMDVQPVYSGEKIAIYGLQLRK